MNKFIYLGKELDLSLEHEFFIEPNENPYGVTATVEFEDGTQQDFNNLTEVHYKYKSFEERCAFESDIHGTGGTVAITDMKSIVVIPATYKTENW